MGVKELLTQTIKDASKEWVYDVTQFVCYMDINSGSCGEFAYYVKERLPEGTAVSLVCTRHYLEEKGLESYGADGGFSNHVWITLNGEHFDIERPYGVKTFMELPFFQRELRMHELGLGEMELYGLIKENPENYKELIYLPE